MFTFIEFDEIIKDALTKKLVGEQYSNFLEGSQGSGKKSVVLENIISTLILLPEDKLTMIYQVIRIITNLNGKEGKPSDISSLLDMEIASSDKVRKVGDDLSSLRKSNNSNDSNSIQPRSINSNDSAQGIF
jgi:hypothetical protein